MKLNDISTEEFKVLYAECVNDIMSKIDVDKIQGMMATHNAGWNKPFDIIKYYQYAWKDYWMSYQMILNRVKNTKQDGKPVTICDIGGFFGIFALIMTKLGAEVTMTETLIYYGNIFDGLYDFLKKEKIEIEDYDIFEPNNSWKSKMHYDIITAIAVIEHYPYSLKNFIENCKSMSKPNGFLLILVPNIARAICRINFFLGNSMLANVRDVWNSEIPFTGHCHEYTMYELETLAELSNFTVVEEKTYNNVDSSLKLFEKFMKSILSKKKDARDMNAIMYEMG